MSAKKINQPQDDSLLDNLPQNSSTFLRSKEIQDRASNVGLDWENVTQVIAALHDEIVELEEGIARADQHEIFDELGDVLFTCVNVARHLGLDLEQALEHSNQKFIRRFKYIEKQLNKEQKQIKDFSFKQLLVLWEEAKVNS